MRLPQGAIAGPAAASRPRGAAPPAPAERFQQRSSPERRVGAGPVHLRGAFTGRERLLGIAERLQGSSTRTTRRSTSASPTNTGWTTTCYLPILAAQDAADQVPNLTVIWLPDDHTNGTTSGTPLPNNDEADNDLALGRLVDAISHSKARPSSAIFVTEDDSQDGVDPIDGYREPAYIISPYAAAPQVPGVGRVINTTYTVVNMERTIENILGVQPLTQFDRVASPMFNAFQNTPDNMPFTTSRPARR